MTYDAEAQKLLHSGVTNEGRPHQAVTIDNLAPRDGSLRLRFLVDRLSLETYAHDGEFYRAHYYSPQRTGGRQSIHAVGGKVRVKTLTIRELKSAWKP